MNYIYSKIEDCVRYFEDAEIRDLVKDVASLFYDREWYLSGDYSEGTWNESLAEFKNKWFEQPRDERLKKIIDTKCNDVKKELHQLIGDVSYCKDCANWERNSNRYGDCEHHKYCSLHGYEVACDLFEERDRDEK